MAISGSSSSKSISVASGQSASYGGALAMVTTLFFMWGFLTSLNDILIPHLKSIFELNYTRSDAGAVRVLHHVCGLLGIPSGKMVEWIGYKKTMVAGLLTMGVGRVLFIPAAKVPSYPLFLGALIVLAAGITALQVAANPYVTVLGPARTASSRLNLTQAFNSLGTVRGRFSGRSLILRGAPSKVQDSADASAAISECVSDSRSLDGQYSLPGDRARAGAARPRDCDVQVPPHRDDKGLPARAN